MDNRNNRTAPRPVRAERLATALRANLKRRKAQARGRSGEGEPQVQGENRPDRPNPENKDGSE
jgi:hypothetical protein